VPFWKIYELIFEQQNFHFEIHCALKDAWILVLPYLKRVLAASMHSEHDPKQIAMVLIDLEHQCEDQNCLHGVIVCTYSTISLTLKQWTSNKIEDDSGCSFYYTIPHKAKW